MATSAQDDGISLKNRLNQRLEGHFARVHDYDEVHVRLVYWQDSDNPGFKREADELADLFRSELRYSVESMPIPSIQSQLALQHAIVGFLLQHGSANNLLIIHYGGHGDADDDTGNGRERRAVWAACGVNGPKLDGFEIQPQLKEANADILLIFDCCHSAQAARGNLAGNRVELLAACASRLQCPGPGPDSFTTAIIRQIRNAIALKEPISVSEMHRLLVERSVGLMQTAIFVVLQAGRGRKGGITLEPMPLNHNPIALGRHQQVASSLLLRMSTRSKIDNDTVDQILFWLKSNAPRVVSGLAVEQVCLSTATLRAYVRRSAPTRTTHWSNPMHTAVHQSETLEQCQALDDLLATAPIQDLQPYGQKARNDERATDATRSFVQRLIEREAELKKSIVREIVSACQEEKLLAKAIEDDTMRKIGVWDTLKLRHTALYYNANVKDIDRQLRPQTATTGTEHSRKPRFELKQTHAQASTFTEYKYYSKDDNNAVDMQTSGTRIQQLADLLKTPKSSDFHSLKCLQWFHEPDLHRFALAFQVPFQAAVKAVTLRDVIRHTKTSLRPSLEERFRIAWYIGQAISKWHLAGWVHQRLASHSILFFQREGEMRINYARPYLCGFEYARPSDAPSYIRFVDNLPSNVHCHPDRQGYYPSVSHGKNHDIYSYGVLLLELGLWQLAEVIFENNVNLEGEDMKQEIIKHAETRLGYFMGGNYKRATVTCLKGDFGVELDDRAELKLSKAFDCLVLKQVEPGKSLG